MKLHCGTVGAGKDHELTLPCTKSATRPGNLS